MSSNDAGDPAFACEPAKRVMTNRRRPLSSSTGPLGPPPVTGICFETLGTNVSFSSAAVSKTPILLDPKAAT
jgi:hypothetical protein